jgi:hypothetical protein
MNLTDIRRTIIESPNAQWFNAIQETISFNYLGLKFQFTGLSSIYEFAEKQYEGWEKLGNNLPTELLNSKTFFLRVKSQIEGYLVTFKNSDLNQITHQWNEIRNSFSQSILNLLPIKYNCAETEFLINIYGNYPNSFSTAFDFIIGIKEIRLNNKNSLMGAILAYEFTQKEVSNIAKRSVAERGAIKTLEGLLEQKISETESEFSNHIRLVNEKYNEFTTKIDTLKNEKNSLFSEWFEETTTTVSEFNTNSKHNIKALEDSYDELLKLKKPAEYWQERAVELQKEGWKAMNWLIGLVIGTCLILYVLLWITPESMLTSFFNGDRSNSIRWSIIFITFISFIAFGIRILNKAAFSAFHLSRDAEERYRLTFVYLAMIKDSSVDKSDRQLIMQSLFSRADTGLLKEDSSPTMPNAGSFLDKFGK